MWFRDVKNTTTLQVSIYQVTTPLPFHSEECDLQARRLRPCQHFCSRAVPCTFTTRLERYVISERSWLQMYKGVLECQGTCVIRTNRPWLSKFLLGFRNGSPEAKAVVCCVLWPWKTGLRHCHKLQTPCATAIFTGFALWNNRLDPRHCESLLSVKSRSSGLFWSFARNVL